MKFDLVEIFIKSASNIGYTILVVNKLVKLIALAKYLTGGQEISPKIPNIAYPVSFGGKLRNPHHDRFM